MIKQAFLAISMASLSTCCPGQTTSSLDDYLITHRYAIHQNVDSTVSFDGTGIPELLSKKMAGKHLLVYGQGFSHMLHLNNAMRRAFVVTLAPGKLRYCFVESARSYIVIDNYFYRHPEIPASSFYDDRTSFYQRSFEQERQNLAHQQYRYLAMDFERPHSFYKAISLLASGLDASGKARFAGLAPYYTDTSYLSISPKNFVHYYKERQRSFLKDSAAFRSLLGSEYQDFKYLLSDPGPSTYTADRNRAMADHLLEQARPIGSDDIFFMSCGMAHARPGKKDGTSKSLVQLLGEDKDLAGKILVVNLYCDDCHAEGGGDNWALGFMKDEVLKSFQKAATTGIVLFDLSGLSGEYEYIRTEYADMLVFARDQQ